MSNLPNSELKYHESPASKAQILGHVADYYGGDPDRRGVKREAPGISLLYSDETTAGSDMGCEYLTKDNRLCAVGLFLSEVEDIYEEDAAVGVLDWDHTVLEEILMPNYQGHPLEFWGDLQGFHDKALHFDEKGLTARGASALEVIYSTWVQYKS